MSLAARDELTPRIKEVLTELRKMISARFPEATFKIEEGFDPPGIYLIATVDIDDTDDVVEVIGDRLVDLQVDEGLPVYVVPLQPVARVMEQMLAQQSHHVAKAIGRPDEQTGTTRETA